MIQLKYFLCFLLSSAPFFSSAQHTQQVIDYQITFSILNAGLHVDGTLQGLQANIFFDPQKPEECVIKATADVNTIETGIRIRDNHLKRSDYFDVENYPTVKLQLKELKPSDERHFFHATFELGVKDVTKSFTAPLFYAAEEESLKISTAFKINRLDFGIGKKSLILSEEVELQLNASLKN